MSGYHFMNRFYSVLVFLLIITGLFTLSFLQESVLTVKEAKTDKIIWQERVEEGTTFAIEYLHSVERTPVWEYFEVKKGEIFLTGTLYESYGAGLPFLKKNNYIVANDKFEIKDINKKLDNIPLRVSDYAKHKLIYGDEEYKLYDITQPQNLVVISVEKKSKIRLLVEEGKRWLRLKN
ncbi:hypothetical protein BX659_1488 [Orenia metallireducens]|uniref:DUF1850 domain-containing protein n=2 Tax=Orenia metallireducens TaxID=1413210 RepID=A0A285H5Z7_9FIRM|nr:hypothetical protein BX659_1488 [Orenia metallireducens]SNY31167.1 hypothetical protein SAMN06265827_11494 [Orenia metallireducens]